MSRVRVESAMKIKDMSRIRVESRWSSFESESSQLDTAWIKGESLIFLQTKRENVGFICGVAGKEPAYNYIRPHRPPPPPGQQFLAKSGKMWWVVSQIWLNSDSNESDVELSQSWIAWIVTWVRVESAWKIWVEHNPATYSTRQKYSAPNLRRRGRVQVKISTWNFINIFISHCHLTYAQVFLENLIFMEKFKKRKKK